MVSFPQISLLKPCIRLSSPPYAVIRQRLGTRSRLSLQTSCWNSVIMMCLTEMCDRVIHILKQRIGLLYLATSFGPQCEPINVRL